MRRLLSLALLFILLITESSCNEYVLKRVKFGDWFRPGGYIFGSIPHDNDDPIYNLAWRDGCESAGAIGGYSGDFTMAFYKYKRDQRFAGVKYGDDRDLVNGKPITDRDKTVYNWIWYRAYGVCRHEFLGNMKNSKMFPVSTGEHEGRYFGEIHGGLGGNDISNRGGPFSIGNIFYNSSVAPLGLW